MLTELYLKNYILIKELRLQFSGGMTVITGETGAGKSILVGALNLVFGKTNSQQVAFDPTQGTYVEITFRVPASYREVHDYLDETGFPAEDNELVIAREFAASGKSTSFLNGRKTSINVLKDLHDLLIDFHHQRDQQKLLLPAFQMDLLDRYGSLVPLRTEFQELYQELKGNLQKQVELLEAEQNTGQLMDLYRFQMDELSIAGLKPGEDTILEQEFNLLSHSEEILNLSDQVYQALYEQDNSLYDTLSAFLAQLRKYSDLGSGIMEICSSLESGVESIQAASSQLRKLNEQMATDPEHLSDVRQRLDLLNNLKTKYKQTTLDGLLAYQQQIEQTLLSYESSSEELRLLAEKIDGLFNAVKAKADLLTQKRTDTAGKLATDIVKNVKQLLIPNVKFEIQIDKKTQDKIILSDISKVFSESGQDSIEFRFSANPDSPVLPLKAIVSGGELSRILLATKKALSLVMPPGTIILDEIDVGIGGKTASSLAEFIHTLAGGFQVLCITHLAQIAATADHHLAIEKKSQRGTTSIQVETLDASNRVNEIARMLSGRVSELSLQHARELLNIE